MQYSDEHLRYLRLLSQKYQTVAAAASEIIRIEALLRLPKGTEHFMSDLHGEHEAFVHILNSASGVIREKIDTVLGNGVPAEERAELATLVYYPNQKLPELKARQKDLHAWYRMTPVSYTHLRAHETMCAAVCRRTAATSSTSCFTPTLRTTTRTSITARSLRASSAMTAPTPILSASARSSSGGLGSVCTVLATCLTAARARAAFGTA